MFDCQHEFKAMMSIIHHIHHPFQQCRAFIATIFLPEKFLLASLSESNIQTSTFPYLHSKRSFSFQIFFQYSWKKLETRPPIFLLQQLLSPESGAIHLQNEWLIPPITITCLQKSQSKFTSKTKTLRNPMESCSENQIQLHLLVP